ncbi:GPI-anchored cell wall organization protein Ecm33 [Histoplasma capsulatum]|uniref:GPI-anchored cell wall organization protein Ecm33 n=1 Tax=Ajellomyces capsulatus TaxID=5037 RepID=A0A8A1MH74_AJECA|nr:GPI-anchored cell wall organization protein Ecm33 [Histoplasma capsulatum]
MPGKALLLTGILTVAVNAAIGSQLDEEPRACDDFMINIATQEDIDFYSTCPTIEEAISFGINHTFKGPFQVPNVKYIAGNFGAGYLGPKLKFSDRVDDAVTSISMPDLEEVGDWVLMAYLNELTNVSFPKLRTIGNDLVMAANPELKKVTFPALENVSAGILIDGDFDEIHLPALKHAAYLIVKSTGDLDCRALGKNLSSLVFHPNPRTDEGKGFTCWTFDENNRYNSSDPNPTIQNPLRES